MEKFQNQCKWAIPDVNKDMTVFYHCISPNAISTLKQTKFVDCFCLGFVDICTEYEKNLKKGLTIL